MYLDGRSVLGTGSVFIKPIYLTPVVVNTKESALMYYRSFVVLFLGHKGGGKHIPQGAIGAYLHTHTHSRKGCFISDATSMYIKPTFALSTNTYISYIHIYIQRDGKKCFVRGPQLFISEMVFYFAYMPELLFYISSAHRSITSKERCVKMLFTCDTLKEDRAPKHI